MPNALEADAPENLPGAAEWAAAQRLRYRTG